MITQELQKLNRLEKEIEVIKTLIANVIPYDNEGEYKQSFKNEMKKLSKGKIDFEYQGKGSLIKELVK